MPERVAIAVDELDMRLQMPGTPPLSGQEIGFLAFLKSVWNPPPSDADLSKVLLCFSVSHYALSCILAACFFSGQASGLLSEITLIGADYADINTSLLSPFRG